MSLCLNGVIPTIQRGLRVLMVMTGFLVLFVANLVFSQSGLDDTTSLGGTFPVFLIAGPAIGLILAGVLGSEALGNRKLIQFLGKISYVLYVYHGFCLLLVARVIPRLFGQSSALLVFAAGLPITVGIAVLSYRYLESPFLRMKERFAAVQSRAI
jgi:peptidoglycan/LPS O-acetylase OafA/YrhL